MRIKRGRFCVCLKINVRFSHRCLAVIFARRAFVHVDIYHISSLRSRVYTARLPRAAITARQCVIRAWSFLSLPLYPSIYLSLHFLTLFVTVSFSRSPPYLSPPSFSLFIVIFLFFCFSRASCSAHFFYMRNSLYAPIIALASR